MNRGTIRPDALPKAVAHNHPPRTLSSSTLTPHVYSTTSTQCRLDPHHHRVRSPCKTDSILLIMLPRPSAHVRCRWRAFGRTSLRPSSSFHPSPPSYGHSSGTSSRCPSACTPLTGVRAVVPSGVYVAMSDVLQGGAFQEIQGDQQSDGQTCSIPANVPLLIPYRIEETR